VRRVWEPVLGIKIPLGKGVTPGEKEIGGT